MNDQTPRQWALARFHGEIDSTTGFTFSAICAAWDRYVQAANVSSDWTRDVGSPWVTDGFVLAIPAQRNSSTASRPTGETSCASPAA
jgi:hypothetical protein